MTKEFLVRCTACDTKFIAKIPDKWTKEELQDYTKDIFCLDKPLNCWSHPRRGTFETLDLDEDWLNNRFDGHKITREVTLPVYREGRHSNK